MLRENPAVAAYLDKTSQLKYPISRSEGFLMSKKYAQWRWPCLFALRVAIDRARTVPQVISEYHMELHALF